MFNVIHTDHGAARMKERGITDNVIRHVIVHVEHSPDGNRIRSCFAVNEDSKVFVVWSMVPAGATVITAFVRGRLDINH